MVVGLEPTAFPIENYAPPSLFEGLEPSLNPTSSEILPAINHQIV